MSDDPLAETPWSDPATIAGFKATPPNPELIEFSRRELERIGRGRALDIGCGAGRNAIPLADAGWQVLGVDLSLAALRAAAARSSGPRAATMRLALASMDALPVSDRSVDFLVAHGIWNLARSAAEFRRAVADAARAAKPGAALFVFTFSRTTLAANAEPVEGEAFVFTQFSGRPQVFLTREQLLTELQNAGFAVDPEIALRELNRPRVDALSVSQTPVIHQGVFRRK